VDAKRFEEELAIARRRNAERLSRARRPLRFIRLRRFESATLRLQGEVEIDRSVWPLRKPLPFCTWARAGETLLIVEDVKRFGQSPRTALNVYWWQDEYEQLDPKLWTEYDAETAPKESAHFPTFCFSTVRVLDKWRWRIGLRKLP
jgi:hypothetical protein